MRSQPSRSGCPSARPPSSTSERAGARDAWPLVTRVAEALREAWTLSGDEVARLVKRDVAEFDWYYVEQINAVARGIR
jgi:hypothetical protein